MLSVCTQYCYDECMERFPKKSLIASNLLAVSALTACAFEIDSYHTDPSDVRCDDGRTKVELDGNGRVTFMAHGEKNKDPVVITVRRENDQVSVRAEGNITGPPQAVEQDGFSSPTPLVDGAELSTFGAGGAWVIDAREESVVIEGTCEGM